MIAGGGWREAGVLAAAANGTAEIPIRTRGAHEEVREIETAVAYRDRDK
jgi:hypothetical protein